MHSNTLDPFMQPVSNDNSFFAPGSEEIILKKSKELYSHANTMIDAFRKSWEPGSNTFKEVPFNKTQMEELFEEYCQRFSPGIDYTENYGFIEKRDVEPESRIFVRADLHGDLKSLLENLAALRELGLLDEEYRCNSKVHLVFLGDYMDRGEHGLTILALLARLKMENPKQVHLIRGNHEDVLINIIYGNNDKDFQAFTDHLDDEAKIAFLTRIYQTMPLTLYLGEERKRGTKEYVQFTHGMFEIKQDPSDVIDSPEPIKMMAVPKKQAFSERINTLMDGRKGSFEKYKYQLNRLRSQLKPDKKAIREIKQKIAARRIGKLALWEEKNRSSDELLTTYMWGDVSDERESVLGTLLDRSWKITAQDIKHYLRISGSLNKVKLLFRGHQHKLENHSFKDKNGRNKTVVSTLPVGMENERFQKDFPGQPDLSYVLTTGRKVRDWKKVALKRAPGSSKSTVGKSISII